MTATLIISRTDGKGKAVEISEELARALEIWIAALQWSRARESDTPA